MRSTLLSAKAVMEEFGGICEMTLHRWLADESMGFPRPIYIKRRRYFGSEQIDLFKRRLLKPPPETTRTAD